MSQTFGQKAVGASFNPSGSGEVDKLKGLYAEIIDLLNDMRGSEGGEKARLASVAITEAQGAQMWVGGKGCYLEGLMHKCHLSYWF
jgi:hypothetical protein